jgi:hypothetical protein
LARHETNSEPSEEQISMLLNLRKVKHESKIEQAVQEYFRSSVQEISVAQEPPKRPTYRPITPLESEMHTGSDEDSLAGLIISKPPKLRPPK